MTPDELVDEAGRLRTVITDSAGHLQAIYGHLHTRVRRAPSDEATSSYMNVVNAGKRFSGMVIQAAKRVDVFDRMLVKVKQDQEESVHEKARQEERKKRARESQEASEKRDRAFRSRLFGYNPQVTQDDLIELFGGD
jgi:peptidoglycan hydrolase CwlO-like protein